MQIRFRVLKAFIALVRCHFFLITSVIVLKGKGFPIGGSRHSMQLLPSIKSYDGDYL